MEMTLIPQFSDSDALGHINYLSVARWFEEGRSHIYRFLFPKFLGNDRFLVLVHMEMDYPGETVLDREVTIQTAVEDVGRTSFTVRQESWQDGRLCVTGKFVLVYFDLVARKALPIDDVMRQRILQWPESP